MSKTKSATTERQSVLERELHTLASADTLIDERILKILELLQEQQPRKGSVTSYPACNSEP